MVYIIYALYKPANEEIKKINVSLEGDFFSKLPNWQVYIMHID